MFYLPAQHREFFRDLPMFDKNEIYMMRFDNLSELYSGQVIYYETKLRRRKRNENRGNSVHIPRNRRVCPNINFLSESFPLANTFP